MDIKTRHHNKTTNQVRNAVANIFFSAIILTGVIMFFISYYVYANDERGDASDMGNTNNSIVDDNLTNKKPTEWWRLNANGYSQRYVYLTGTDRVERMRQLLAHYGHDNYEARKTISRVYHVYPEILICIAYADTSLGKFTKTENNIGNVGNNDRGDTVTYKTIEEGINGIGKTLNNRYLGQYTLIGQLSPYGNMNGSPFYATSNENWGINVLNCLGMIHNKQINNDWNFRR